MESSAEPKPSGLPELPPGVTIRPLLHTNHWRRLIPSSLVSSLLHAFFLFLAAFITVSEYTPEPVRPTIDTRVSGEEERLFDVRRVEEPKIQPPGEEIPLNKLAQEKNKADGDPTVAASQPEVKASPANPDEQATELLPIPQPAESAKLRSPDVIYVPTPPEVVDAMLKLAKVQKGEVVMDLGCGDGRIPIAAVKDFGARGFGYDIDPERIKEAKENARQHSLTNRVVFEQRDIFKLDLSRADVVTLYLLPSLNAKLIPQFQQMKRGTRIVSHAFDIDGIKPDQVIRVRVSGYERIVYLWTLPLIKEDGQPLAPPPDPSGKLSVSEDEVLWNMIGIRATVQPGGGLKVEELKPRGPASRVGMRVGDVLVMLGGYDVHSKRAESVHLIRLRPESMSFEVIRGKGRILDWIYPDAWER